MAAGEKIRALIGSTDPVQYYVSPFWRTRQTFLGVRYMVASCKDNYYEDLAEEWEGAPPRSGGGKKKATPTTVGRQRQGGAAALTTTVQLCRKGCMKKCCARKKTTPVIKL